MEDYIPVEPTFIIIVIIICVYLLFFKPVFIANEVSGFWKFTFHCSARVFELKHCWAGELAE